MGSGTVSTGAVWSSMVTVKLDAEALPWASVTAQVTVVGRAGAGSTAKVLPEAGTQLVARAPSTMSEAVGLVKETTAPAAEEASAVMSAGTLAMTGLEVSCTLTLKDAVP